MTVKLVRDLMHIGVATCRVDIPLVEAVRTLLRENLESLVVLDSNGHAVGLFGRREAVAAYGLSGLLPLCPPYVPPSGGDEKGGSGPPVVADVMRPDIPEIPPHIPATAAAQIMLDQHVRELYLMHHDGGIRWPAAVFRFEDVLRYLAAESEQSLTESKPSGLPG